MTSEHEKLYRQRFADVNQEKRAAMWAVLCQVILQPYIAPMDTVVDLGAGFCEFINTIRCASKIAIDTSPAVFHYAGTDVQVLQGEVPAVMTGLGDGSAQVVFCSNFLEHLPNKDAVMRVLREVYRLLTSGGRLIIVQPNIRYAYKEYWDFFDHHVPLSHASLSEALQMTGFRIDTLRPRFLPYTTKSRLPQAAWLARLYLACPPAQWLLGKQMLVVARKAP